MAIEQIAMYILNLEKILTTVYSYLTYFWWGVFLIFVIKSIITKLELDKMKRNMILIKCTVVVIVGYMGLIVLKMLEAPIHFYSNFLWFGIHIIGIVLMLLNLTILLFYSGTPFIFCNKKIQYSWPFHFINERKNNTIQQ